MTETSGVAPRITYVDSSAILRVLLGQPGAIDWSTVGDVVSSELVRVECLRTLDRVRVQGRMSDEDLAERRSNLLGLLDTFHLISLGHEVLSCAAMPFPTALGTLDALHLASALLYRDSRGPELRLATHDRALALAGRALGLEVIGA